jgi:hypothetical protein
VREKLWSYGGGFKVGQGDFLEFNQDTTTFHLREDTIFYKLRPRARIIRINKRLFFMTIKAIETNETGTYRNVEEMFSLKN